MIRRLVTWGPVLILAVLLALWLAGAIQDQLIGPLAYLAWLLGLYLRSVSQSIYWVILIGVVALIVLASLLGGLRLRRQARERRVRVQGPVEQAAALVHGARRGPYFRWLVALRLANLAQATLAAPGSAPSPAPALRGPGWAPPPNVQTYLEAGLDRPPVGRTGRGGFPPWRKRPPNALDGASVAQVVEFLESQLEMKE